MIDDDTREANDKEARAGRGRAATKIAIPVVLLILAAGLVGAYWYLHLRGQVSTDDAYVDGDAVTISAKILGRVAMLGAAEGDAVAPQQLLVRLDDSDLRAQEAQAKAGLEHAEENVSVAKISLDRAQGDYDRAAYQYKERVVTREQFDHSRQALDLAKAQYKVALSQVNVSKSQLDVIETQIGNTSIYAPQSGVVARKWVVPGDIVQPGQPIFTLYDLKDLWITANLEETKLGAVRPGDPVRISVDAHKGCKLTGTVTLIGAAAASRFSLIPPNNASGNFTKVTQRIPIRISIGGPETGSAGEIPALLPGMSVEVKIRVKEE